MSGDFLCSYCLANFAYKRSLDQHLKSAKYCIKKRLANSVIKCICEQKFETNELLLIHQQECVILKLNKLQHENEYQQQHIIKLEKQVEYLQGYINSIKDDKEKYYNTVEKAALKSTSTTNNYNKILTFPILDKPRMTEKCQLITPTIVRRGQPALANFFVDKIATNEKGEIGLICTDKTRKTFKYLREDGKIVTDIEAVNLINKFRASSADPIKKSLEQIKTDIETDGDDLYDTPYERLDEYYKVSEEAKAFGGPFLAKLVKRTYKKEEDGKVATIES